MKFKYDKERPAFTIINVSKNKIIICTYKVDNEKVWKKVKEKEFKGFSLEGLFNLNLLKETFNKNYDLNKIVKNLINDEN